MRRYLTWLWKEWRDHRAVTIGVFVALPALTALAYWAFGEQLRASAIGNVYTTFLGIAVGLMTFGIASDVVAGEIRRGTMALVRRVPGGLGVAFAAKLTFLVLLVLVGLTVQGVSLGVAETANAGDHRGDKIWAAMTTFPMGTYWLIGLGFGVVSLWTLLTSCWLGRSGVAGAAAIVLLAALAAPFWLFYREHPYFFPGVREMAGWVAILAGAVAILAVSLSFLRGHRFHARPLRPFLLGGLLLVVALGGGYAYAAHALDDWLDIEPGAKDFRIYEAHLGAGERHLFLTVHRGYPWLGDHPMHIAKGGGDGTLRGTPLQAWVVDLKTGRRTVVDEGRPCYFTTVPEVGWVNFGTSLALALEPTPALALYGVSNDDNPAAVGWWDAREARPVRVLPWGVRDAQTLDLARAALAAASPLRDAQGRRIWMRDGVIEREGTDFEVPTGLVPRPTLPHSVWPVPGGWFGYRRDLKAGMGPWVFIDAETGAEQEVASRKNSPMWPTRVLSAEHLFVFRRRRAGEKRVNSTRLVARMDDFEDTRPPANPPDIVGFTIDANEVLGLRGEGGRRTVHVWDPVTGSDRELRWTGAAVADIDGVSLGGRAADGRWLLQLGGKRKRGSIPVAWALLDAKHERLTLLHAVDEGHAGQLAPFALLADGSVLFLEGKRRIVRCGPEEGQRTVVFP